MIGMSLKPTTHTEKLGLRLPVPLVDCSTFWTTLTRVGCVHQPHTHACKQRLVSDEPSQLVKCPSSMLRSLAFPNRYPDANSLEVLKSNSASGVSSLRYDAFTDAMILDGSKSGLLTRDFLESSFSALGSASLKSLPMRRVPLAGSFNFCPRMKLGIGVHRKIADPKVDPEPTLWVNRGAVWNIYGHKEVKLTPAVNEISLSSNAFKTSTMVGPDGTRNRDTTIEGQDRESVQTVLESVESLVIWERPERVKLGKLGLISFVDFADFTDSSYGMLSAEIECLADLVVEELLKPKFVSRSKLKSFLGDPVASCIGTAKCLQKAFLLGFIGQELHGSDQFHLIDTRRISKPSTKESVFFLPSGGGGSAEICEKPK